MRYYTVETRKKESDSRVYTWFVYNIAAESEQKMMSFMNLVMDRGEFLVDFNEDIHLHRTHQKAYEQYTADLLKRYADRTFGRHV